MSDFALLGWGMMIGSWITSLWIMRKDVKEPVDHSRAILSDLAIKLALGRKFAPDCRVEAQAKIKIGGKQYRVSLEPGDQERHA